MGTPISLTDEQVLSVAMMKFFGYGTMADFNASDVGKALVCAGKRGWKADFLGTSKTEITRVWYWENMTSASGTVIELPDSQKAKLYCLLAFYHHMSRKIGSPALILKYTKADFDEFRVTEWDPDSTIVPWKRPLPPAARNAADLQVEQWSKQIKPSMSDYDEFKDEALWVQHMRRFLSALDPHNLQHLIDGSYVVTNP